MRHFVELQHTHHIFDGRDAVDQPGMLIAADDLLFLFRGADQVTHDRAHHIVEGDDADDAAVLVDDDGKVFMDLAKLLQHLGQTQAVGHDEDLVNQRFIHQRQWLVVERALKQIFGIHIANHTVNIAVAHRVGGERLFGNAGADDVVVIVLVEKGNPFAQCHGRGYGARIQLEYIGNHLLFAGLQHASFGTRFGHGEDVFGGDALIARGGQAQQAKQGVGDEVVKPDDGLEDQHKPAHGCQHAHDVALGLVHADAARQQVGQQDEGRGDYQE